MVRVVLAALLLCAGLPLLLWLGFWQWERGAEKARLVQLRQEREALSPAPLAHLWDAPLRDLQLRRVALRGVVDQERVFLLDNRVRDGRVGYEVISPMHYEEQHTVLLNRGWVAAAAHRRQLPQVSSPGGRQHLYGRIHVALGAPLVLGAEEPATGWPRVVQDASPALLAKYFPERRVFPHQVRLEPSAATFLARWPGATRISAARHRAYALQWFALAAVLLLYMVLIWRRRAQRA